MSEEKREQPKQDAEPTSPQKSEKRKPDSHPAYDPKVTPRTTDSLRNGHDFLRKR